MSWNSVNHILGCLQIESQLEEQPLQILLRLWTEVVGEAIATHTQPLLIQRGVLRVATPSAAWAQNLAFERRRLLVKINAVLPSPLKDIRFSTAGWQPSQATTKIETTASPQEHPSYLGIADLSSGDRTINKNAHAAFEHWARKIHKRSQTLPLCPQCQCPTPPGELERWQLCSLCTAKQFRQTNHRGSKDM
ncbi:MAG: DciA family protein [Calothrix sp. MO_192.B10]|nr:DciA family protein [Calothrix sp. MO_192.B10]